MNLCWTNNRHIFTAVYFNYYLEDLYRQLSYKFLTQKISKTENSKGSNDCNIIQPSSNML